jgi:hypothetical protein
MAAQPHTLAQRRRNLLAQTTQQRQALATQTRSLTAPFSGVAHSLEHLKRHPVWLAGIAIAAIAVMRPRRIRSALALAQKTTRALAFAAPLIARLRR